MWLLLVAEVPVARPLCELPILRAWLGNVGVAGQDGRGPHRVSDAETGYVAHQGTVVECLGSPWLVPGAGLEGSGAEGRGGHEGLVGLNPQTGAGLHEIATEMRASLSCNEFEVGRMSGDVGVAW